METRRARNREVLPRQHPITGKSHLLSSSDKEAICRWIGTVFSGWDVGGPFATPQERKYSRATVGTGDTGPFAPVIALPLTRIAGTCWYTLGWTSGELIVAADVSALSNLFHSASTDALAFIRLATATLLNRWGQAGCTHSTSTITALLPKRAEEGFHFAQHVSLV